MLLGLVSRDEDDDGQAAGQSVAAVGAIAEINRLAEKPAFLAWTRANRSCWASSRRPEFQRVIGHYSARLSPIDGRRRRKGRLDGTVHPDWYAARLGKATASRIADIAPRTKPGYSTSRANYAAQLICERLTGVQAEALVSAAMTWGVEKGAEATRLYEFEHDVHAVKVGFVDLR